GEFMASKAAGPEPNELIVNNNETLRVIYMNKNGSVKLEPASGTTKQSNDNDTTNDDTTNDDTTNDDTTNDDTTKKPATPEETTAKSELEEAEASGDKDKINEKLEKHEKTVQGSQ